MEIRQLLAIDVVEYQKIRLEALTLNPEAFSSSYEEECTCTESGVRSRLTVSDGQMVLGCFIDNALVGTIGIGRQGQNKTNHKCFIWGMYVSPNNRRLGIARALLEEAINQVNQVESVQQLTISVVEKNESALNLYESVGFKEYGREPNALIVAGKSYGEILMAQSM